MSVPHGDSLGQVLGERRHLLAVAFRMLGTSADAEDAVQEAYARWFRLSDDERAGIRSPEAWLTRVTANVCLDVLGSARHRREQYVGEWLPEPLSGTAVGGGSTAVDPLDRVTLDDSVTMALLVMLESLTPAERVAFVLHDVFAMPFDEIAVIVGRTPQATRKLASTARRHIAERRRREASAERHDEVVREFWAACESGDLSGLLTLLDPSAVTRVDGGGQVRAVLKPILGADKVARFLLGGLAKQGELVPSLETVHGLAGIVFRLDGIVAGVATLDVHDDLVTDIWFTLNPAKLTTWNQP
ncbi:RNA polymerase sigma factor SigJ [Herbiconiux sp. A18JL235]|uniref:RNA polymerase sigma factor SigJ n=1 Tax=Herbiconiux sp. A18JL235 TaxID=3152363 RepID=A0AB39BH43_9MICO